MNRSPYLHCLPIRVARKTLQSDEKLPESRSCPFRREGGSRSFVEFKGDIARWHDAMLDFVLLNLDPNHTQINHCLALSSSKKTECYIPLTSSTYRKALLQKQVDEKKTKKRSETKYGKSKATKKRHDQMTRTLKKSSSQHY